MAFLVTNEKRAPEKRRMVICILRKKHEFAMINKVPFFLERKAAETDNIEKMEKTKCLRKRVCWL